MGVRAPPRMTTSSLIACMIPERTVIIPSMRRRAPVLALAATTLSVACNHDYPNPFEDPSLINSVPPPAGTSIVFTSDGWSAAAGHGAELRPVATDGSQLTRLTFCDNDTRPCDTFEAALAPDNQRAATLRVIADSNGDGVLDERDDASLVFLDLVAQAEAELVPASQRATGIDWAPAADILVYSAQGIGGEDLFRTTPQRPTPDNAQETVDLSCPSGTQNCDATVGERRPRIDPTGSIAAFSRIAGGGAAEVWVFQTTANQSQVTTGSSGGALLAGTPYLVGSDTDPSFSPDGRTIVFRHLTATTSDGRGRWELRTARSNGTELQTLVSDDSWLGAPVWGGDGILFPEADASGTRLVLIAEDGARRAIVSFPAGTRIDNPRWLRR